MKPSLHKGVLSHWNDDRGFGFIQPEQGGQPVFLHISALKTKAPRPQERDIISYQLSHDAKNRPRATQAAIQGVRTPAAHRTQPAHSASTRDYSQVLSRIGAIAGLGMTAMLIAPQLIYADSQLYAGKQPIDAKISRSIKAVSANGGKDCPIKGNISFSSGKRYYHLPGMRDYDITIISPEKGERWFCSEKEAIASGWRKAPTPPQAR